MVDSIVLVLFDCLNRSLRASAIHRLPPDNAPPVRVWISEQWRKIMAPDPIHVTNVIVNDKTSARAWGHCTARGCKATMSCGVSWQPDHAIFTCFTKKEHHHPVPPECVRREALELSAKKKASSNLGEGSQLTQLLRKTAH